ncbi:carbohydrate esterase family 3 protein [Durotheca rogersii]|uniref:carbohydrate esterase family 3 protein n=1 Tax=Durotheca rogersii TaxID=419775 RepID=UPI00221F37B9|nr:carbohydrate esterase family 3 protein [Durotheca rogersii]KAI5865482.1 carbohydrate esterase family 3 protein [Durotheca rogersii]
MPNIYRLAGVSAVALAVIILFFTNTVDVKYQWNRFAQSRTGTSPSGSVAGGMPLRIMFMGASVTRGEVSTGDRGYRKYIRDNLTALGNPVNCVGFNRFGDFADNDVEGYGANRIRQLRAHAAQAVPYLQPNLVLIQVGTSDCFQKDDPINILARMRDLVEYLLEASPRATVIMSTVLTTPNLEFEPCMRSANAQIRQAATDLMREKKPVALAEMHFDQGLPRRPRPEDIGNDRIHPTDEGYFMMGDIFLEKIREVEQKGFLQYPADNGIADDGEASREVEDQLKEKAKKEHPLKA